jgi:DNA-binding GntR family transcriptional regulator
MCPGERVTERGLEARLAISRTPIRAALAKLESGGLVARDSLGFREGVGTEVVRPARERAKSSDVDLVEEIARSCAFESPRSDWHRISSDFHIERARPTGTTFAMRAVQDAVAATRQQIDGVHGRSISRQRTKGVHGTIKGFAVIRGGR